MKEIILNEALNFQALGVEEREVFMSVHNEAPAGLLRNLMDTEEIHIANTLVKKGYLRKGTSADRQGTRAYYLASEDIRWN